MDAIQSGTTEVAASNLANHFKSLTEFNKGHGDELLEDDFKVSSILFVEAMFALPFVIFTFTQLRVLLYALLLMKMLPVHISPFSNKYAMITVGVHIVLAKKVC